MKLNLGAGRHILEGFQNLDRCTGDEIYPLPFVKDGEANVVRASHVLEHFSHRETLNVLKEWARVLKPGGWLKIAVPNLQYAVEHSDHDHFEMWLMGGHVDANDHHGALFTAEKLKKLLESVGLVNVQAWTSEIKDCASLPVSLNLMGQKPEPKPATEPSIVGLISRPRFGPLDTTFFMGALQAAYGFAIRPYGGVFWERAIQNALYKAVQDGYDFAVTFDFDIVFTVENFNTLLKYMKEHPECDAVAPLQPMRGRADVNLLVPVDYDPEKKNKTTVARSGQAIACKSAHFGLTLFRLSRLKDIPLPWFMNSPAPNGHWKHDDGCEDADIFFWRKWHENGRTLHVLPWVCTGQIETKFLMCEKGTGKTESVYPEDWIDANYGRKQVQE